jgi:predicted nucleic acid-binding protein
VETSFLVERHLGPRAEAAFLRSLSTSGVTIDRLLDTDLERIADLIYSYADLSLGAVDASVIAVAERRGVTTIATIDRRHFTVVRPAHASHFDLLP